MRKLRTFCFGLLFVATLTMGSGGEMQDFPRIERLVGIWEVTSDATPGVPPGSLFVSFSRGGVLNATTTVNHANGANLDPVCGCNSSDGFGTWRRTGFDTFAFTSKAFLFAGPTTATIPNLNLSESVVTEGQHVGTIILKNGVIRVVGDTMIATNIGQAVNLDGDQLNDLFPSVPQTFTGVRMKIER